MGNYNIALQLANMTKIVPQIVQYHTTLAVSNISDKRKIDEAVHIFLKANFVISLCIMVGYILFGKLLISVIAKTQYEEIFNYGLYILGGLSLINLFRSLVAYSIVSHSIKQVVLLVNLPAAIFALAAYFIGGIYWGVQGVLVANVLISIVLSLLIIVYINRNTDYKWSYSLITEYEIALLKDLWAKMIQKQPIA
jgi:O-antigen/teichoic acid export membrane protein